MNFLSQIWILDLDIIRDQDKYVEASSGSALQNSNNSLTWFDDMRRKIGIFELVSNYAAKKRISNFLKNIKIWCLDSKYRSEMFRNRKSTFETYLQDAGWNMDCEKMKFLLKDFITVFGLKFGLKNANKILKKKFHFFEIHISTSILQVCFECALSIPKHFRTIFST